MSWNITVMGKPKNIVAHLNEYSGTLTGASKEEFDEALPGITSLLEQNIYTVNGEDKSSVITLAASGSGYVSGDVVSRTCIVKIEANYVKFV